MKKLVSLLLVLLLVVSSCASVFAGNYGGYTPKENIVINSVGGNVTAERLSATDAVALQVKNAGSAANFVKSVGLSAKADSVFKSYSVAGEMFSFKGSNGASVTFAVKGVKAGDTVAVLVNNGSSWEFVPATAGDDKVTATFNELGKVVVLVGEAAEKTTSFVDVPVTEWYNTAVEYCVANGIMNGIGGGKFGPSQGTTRSMVATMIYRLEGSPAHAVDYKFTDCPDSWYQQGIAWALENGIVTGYNDTKFGPNDPVTREQLVAMLGRYFAYKGNQISGGSVSEFADQGNISGYAREYVRWAVGYGLLNGRLNTATGEKNLVPTGGAIRAELAQVFYNYLTK